MSESSEQPQPGSELSVTLAKFAGQIGCLTIVIIAASLYAGFWIDNQFDTKPWFTLIFIIGSVPLTMYLSYKVAKAAGTHVAASKPHDQETLQEDAEIGRNNS